LGGAVTTVVVAPSDPAVVWAGSSAGVFRSTDGGATWSNVSGPLADVAHLVVHPNDPGKAWALSSSQGVYRTVDGGATWISANKFAGITPTALLIDPRDPDTLYVSGACLSGFEPLPLPWMGVHKSTDGGVTWESVGPAPGLFSQCVFEMAIDPFSPWRLFVASLDGRLESYDRARTWQRPDGARPSLAVIFDPRFPFTHYGITKSIEPRFLVSQDGGFTWSPSATPPPAQPQALSIDPERGRLFLGTSNGVFRSGDGGRVWAKTTVQDVNVGALGFGGTPPSLFAATSLGLFQMPGRGVAESRPIDLHQVASDPLALDVDPTDPNVVYTSTSDWISGVGGTPVRGRFFRSANGGASWESLPADDDVERDRIAVDAAGTLYAASSFRASTLHRRKRGEVKWTLILNTSVYAMAADPKNAGALFISAAGSVERSRDSGDTWKDLGINAIELAIDPSDPRWVYAGSQNHLYRSGDGGDTWIDLLPFDLRNGTRGIVVAPSNGNVVYRIGANNGSPRPERSDDRGTTWHAATLPLGIYPSSLAVDPRNENSVWAAVYLYGEGLFHSTDGGAHWEEVLGAFGTHVKASALRFDPTGRVLHVAYPGHGVWELTVE
jgi:photosystem II stability/assembly factor-like uncharacterized protein